MKNGKWKDENWHVLLNEILVVFLFFKEDVGTLVRKHESLPVFPHAEAKAPVWDLFS